MKKTCFFFPVFFLLLILPSLLYAQPQTFEVTGMLQDEGSVPVAGHPIRLYNGNNKLLATDTTTVSGEFSLIYEEVTPAFAGEGKGEAPSRFQLGPSYPNPFNPRTFLPFEAPRAVTAEISLHTILGREVMRRQHSFTAGNHIIEVNLGGQISQGHYILRVLGEGFNEVTSMTYISAGITSGSLSIFVRGGRPGNASISMKKDLVIQATDSLRLHIPDTEGYSSQDILIPANQPHDTGVIPLHRPAEEKVQVSFCFIMDEQRLEAIDNNNRPNGFPGGGFKEIFDAKGIPLNISVFSSNFSHTLNTMTKEDLISVQSEGWEIMSHLRAGGNYPATPNFDHTVEDAKADLDVRKERHLNKGFEVKNANYLQGIVTSEYLSVIGMNYRSAGIVRCNVNIDPIDIYELNRCSMDFGNYNLWTKMVDEAIENNGLMIFYWHAYRDEHYDQKKDDDGNPDPEGDYVWQKIGRLIDYIQGKPGYGVDDQIKIRTVDDALDHHL